jgi:hypothetical protein
MQILELYGGWPNTESLEVWTLSQSLFSIDISIEITPIYDLF